MLLSPRSSSEACTSPNVRLSVVSGSSEVFSAIHSSTRSFSRSTIFTASSSSLKSFFSVQVARNLTMEGIGFLNGYTALLHDRDTKFRPAFLELIEKNGIDAIALPPRSPNLNCIAERWVRTVKSEVLSRVILLGESSLRRVLSEFQIHYHQERNH